MSVRGKDLKRLGRSISRAADKDDVRAVKAAVERTRQWVSDEQRWLATNQPLECYREIHDTVRRAVDKMDEALDVTAAALETDDASEAWRGVSLLAEAMAILEGYDGPRPNCPR